MGKYVDVSTRDPEKFAAVEEQQRKLRAETRYMVKISRPCPYCDHPVIVMFPGQNGYLQAKCPNCGKEVIFPPIYFRLAND